MEDAALLARCVEGHQPSCAAFVDRHLPALWRFVSAICADRVTAEDVLQDTLLDALRGAPGFVARGGATDPRAARAWLYTIARHRAGRLHRRRVGEPAHFEDEESIEALGAAAGFGEEPASPERAFSAHEERVALEAALARLADADREVLVLRDVEGLSGEEAAEVLGIPLAAVKTRLHRARLRLAAAVRQGGALAR